MAELSTKKSKRASFPRGGQRKFLELAKEKLNLDLEELAQLAGVHVRSLTDWKREKHSMSLPALRKICREVKIPLPRNVEVKDPFWYTSKGSSLGGIAAYKKYGYVGGDPVYRKKKWYEWWESKGKFRKHPIINACLPINRPPRSPELAEFVGILLGDGGVTKRQVIITLHKTDDKEFSVYVKNLMKRLFSVNPSVRARRGENIVNIVISRSELVKFFQKMQLPAGSKVKHQTGVPSWIEKSDEFTKTCLRGLFDTDGCFYVDRHTHKEKIYYNCCMSFTNRSLPILFFFKDGLERFGFHPTHKTKFSVCLRKENEILTYFKKIGSSNNKHYRKFETYFENKYGEVPKWS